MLVEGVLLPDIHRMKDAFSHRRDAIDETWKTCRPLQALGEFHCHRYGVFAGFVVAWLQVSGLIQRKENDYEQYAAIHSDY